MDADWQPLREELDRWHRAGRHVRFWLRDDDAVAPTHALDQLIGLAQTHQAPVLLAVIPAGATLALADHLQDTPLITPCIHGYAHRNHAPAMEKKQELGGHRPVADMADELADGTARLRDLFGARLAPILVPPWNRIAPELLAHLPEIDFEALSAFGRKGFAEIPPGLSLLPTHVDIMDWRGTGGGRAHDDLIAELTRELQGMRDTGDGELGMLTHHLVHDECAWSFLSALLEETAQHPAAKWCDARELLRI